MLKKIELNADAARQWFSDDYFDLIVWYDDRAAIAGFQLCYDIAGDEHSFTWNREGGASHNRIDTGESSPFKNMTPVLLPDGVVPYDTISQKFQERSGAIDQEVVALVLRVLSERPIK